MLSIAVCCPTFAAVNCLRHAVSCNIQTTCKAQNIRDCAHVACTQAIEAQWYTTPVGRLNSCRHCCLANSQHSPLEFHQNHCCLGYHCLTLIAVTQYKLVSGPADKDRRMQTQYAICSRQSNKLLAFCRPLPAISITLSPSQWILRPPMCKGASSLSPCKGALLKRRREHEQRFMERIACTDTKGINESGSA